PPYIIYQGAVNEGRCFESLIPAMRMVDRKLIICGSGNFFEQAKQITTDHHLTEKVIFTGWLEPSELTKRTSSAYIGVNLLESTGLNHQLSLANRFFDYIQSGLPQVCSDFPAYREINDQYHCALLIADTSPPSIAYHINRLLRDQQLYDDLKKNCMAAREHLHWGVEENKLLQFYRDIFDD
ncbi:MAG: glycosyltransferase, partial [Chitinophagaceae bacterium]